MRANAIWSDMGSPEPQFQNAWEIYLHIRDALRSTSWDGAFQQSLSAASQPEDCLAELPADLRRDEDDILVVDNSDDDFNFGSSVEESTPIVVLTDTEDDGPDF